MHRDRQGSAHAGLGVQRGPSLAIDHLRTPGLLRRPDEPEGTAGRPRRPRTTAALWKDVLERRVASHTHILLSSVWVFEWFPRAPGVFHTPSALEARRNAMFFRVEIDGASYHPGIDDAATNVNGALALARSAAEPDPCFVFDPYGKQSMLDGGVGCVRLGPIELPGEDVHWFLSASTTPIAHEGFPLRVDNASLLALRETLSDQGATRCNVAGVLKKLPNLMAEAFGGHEGVPALYLDVDSVEPLPIDTPPAAEVSVAVSFLGTFRGQRDVYASYVTFRPGRGGTFESAVRWLEDTYVKGTYEGEILTDFDQESTHFPSARMRLHDLMRGRVDSDELRETLELFHAAGSYEQVRRILGAPEPGGARPARSQIFICYARPDRSWVDRISHRLRDYGLEARTWEDSNIPAGERWLAEIRDALDRARVAILVVSEPFLSSAFINQVELPELLVAARREEATVLPLVVGSCDLERRFDLGPIQTVNPPNQPLDGLPPDQQGMHLERIAATTREIMRPFLV
jgi:hypothetical protein